MKEFQALLMGTTQNISEVERDSEKQQVVINGVFAKGKASSDDTEKESKGSNLNIIYLEKEEKWMPEQPALIKTRKELYDEIWKISIAGVAKKYNIPYGHMIRQLKIAEIPVPPSGYWMKLSSGKEVSVLELTGDPEESVSIYKTTPGVKSRKKAVSRVTNTSEESLVISENSEIKILPPEIIEQFGKTYNIYKRSNLYEEVWKQPITKIAKIYSVSDSAIHKICKALNVPTPPAGYWSRVRAGKTVKKIPLPKGNYPEQKTGLRSEAIKISPNEGEVLNFLDNESRTLVLAVADQIMLPDEDSRMNSKIIAHRKKVSKWQRELKKNEAKGWGKRNLSDPPFLADTISEEALPRVCRIFDALIKALVPLNCELTNDLKIKVNQEIVSISVTEAKDKIPHIITEKENLELLKYEDRHNNNSYASKPNIRKYDYLFNGRISVTIHGRKTYRDCKAYVVEEMLGDIVLALYEVSDVLRQEREEREEKARQREIERQKKEQQRERYNLEVTNTEALVNKAEDYETACKIRAYISALEKSDELDDETATWIQWAKKKADWYDPTLALNDEYFGKRKHEESSESKVLKKSGYSWW
ncbi:hypothetical protein LI951_14845 [Enterococcus sp. BWT-B8]|uniref:hypothetical protein n=1 Tax=Enterococcus sp. BWT-B8 TaxID=2885157 RepID=UPI001E627F49|nr:hypothetical protein [Enterococcus sp. BWT-B8]MCB5953345.1 hypothetical protein [Enterococcus sp. BWT-B8]